MDFKTNVLNNAHVLQLFHYEAGLLQNDGIIIYLQIKINSLQLDTSNRTTIGQVSSVFFYLDTDLLGFFLIFVTVRQGTKAF